MLHHLAATVLVTAPTLFSDFGRGCNIRPMDSSSFQLKYESRRDFGHGCGCVCVCVRMFTER